MTQAQSILNNGDQQGDAQAAVETRGVVAADAAATETDETNGRGAAETNGQIPAETKEQSAPAPVETKAKPYPWILHPVIDVLFSCGGIVLIMYGGLSMFGELKGDSSLMQMLILAGAAGNAFFNDAHQPATLIRVYGSKTTRDKVGIFVTFWGIVSLVLGAIALHSASFCAGLTRLVLAWQFQHVIAQTYGIALIYCYKRGYIMKDREKNSLFYMLQAALVFCLVRMFTFHSYDKQSLFSLQLPVWGPLPNWVYQLCIGVFAVSVAVFAFMVARRYKQHKQIFPWPALLAISVQMAIIFVPTWQSAAFLVLSQAFYHAAQYLVVTSAYYLKDKGLPEGMPFSKIASAMKTKRFALYTAMLFFMGLAYSGLVPAVLGWLGFSTALIQAAFFCAINIHHYLTDAAIWRLKDPAIRKILIA